MTKCYLLLVPSPCTSSLLTTISPRMSVVDICCIPVRVTAVMELDHISSHDIATIPAFRDQGQQISFTDAGFLLTIKTLNLTKIRALMLVDNVGKV
jgi:hypothetical protein